MWITSNMASAINTHQKYEHNPNKANTNIIIVPVQLIGTNIPLAHTNYLTLGNSHFPSFPMPESAGVCKNTFNT